MAAASCADPLLPEGAQVAVMALCGVLLVLLLVSLLILCARRLPVRLRTEVPFHDLHSGKAVELPRLPPAQRFHIFISHTWRSGQDQAAMLKSKLCQHVPGISIFLDMDDLTNISTISEDIEASAVFLAFLSHGYLASNSCLNELRAACRKEKPLLLVLELSEMHGGLDIDQALGECPDPDVLEYVQKRRDRVICWHRQRDLQTCALLLGSPNPTPNPPDPT